MYQASPSTSPPTASAGPACDLQDAAGSVNALVGSLDLGDPIVVGHSVSTGIAIWDELLRTQTDQMQAHIEEEITKIHAPVMTVIGKTSPPPSATTSISCYRPRPSSNGPRAATSPTSRNLNASRTCSASSSRSRDPSPLVPEGVERRRVLGMADPRKPETALDGAQQRVGAARPVELDPVAVGVIAISTVRPPWTPLTQHPLESLWPSSNVMNTTPR